MIDVAFTKMALSFDGSVLVGAEFFSRKKLSSPKSKYAKEVCRQIQNYCSKRLPNLMFDIELDARGTVFQRKVWQALQQIPAGHVMTYGQLAQQLETSARAVGNACRANPIPLIIPCHRVVSKSGLGGFSGSLNGTPVKLKTDLLMHEGVSL